MNSKPVSESRVEISQLMMPHHANPAGNIFGGVIMSLIDNAALIAGSRHTYKNCVTASVDRIDFISPVYIGNLVLAKSSINYVANTSMEIGVTAEAECLKTGKKVHVASAYLTFVALDENDNPTTIPKLILENEEDERRFREGKKRREQRMKKIKHHDKNTPCMARINK